MIKNFASMKKKSNDIPSITFYFPYMVVSGVSVLFLRMSEYISDNYGIETCVIDYADGYISRTLRQDTLVKVYHFKDGVPMEIPSDTILVMQSSLPYNIRPELKINNSTQIIFWTLHQMNLIQIFIPLPWFRHLQARYINFNKFVMNTVMFSLRNKIRDLIRNMVEKKSIIFPDDSTLKYTSQSLSVPITNPFYVPVPCGELSANKKIQIKNRNFNEGISFGWLGRLSDFKMPTLIYTIRKLSMYAAQKRFPIIMHIIGSGPDSYKISKLKAENEYFRICNVGTLTGLSRDKYLVEKVDVLAAMGTSALDGAGLGIPTLLLDISYGSVSDGYIYRWIFETKDYSMGEMLDDTHYEKGNDSLERAIRSVINEYLEISVKSFEYCMRNHSISSVCEKFINALQEASFCYGDFSPDILKEGFVRPLVRRSYIYKFIKDVIHWKEQ